MTPSPSHTPAAQRDDDAPPVLLSYQQALLAHAADPVVLYEKSRRIGISWVAAEAAVETSALTRAEGGMDTLYIGYNLDMARTFIDDSAFWARHLGAFAGEVPEIEEFIFKDKSKDGDRDIQAFRIRFASGFGIEALSSRPRSLRSKQGFVILDEVAFYDDLEGVIKAALALLIWGGRLWVISTHDGADNYFNELVEDTRAGKKPFTLLRTTFDDAIAAGLYERIRLVAPKGFEIAPKKKWISDIRDFYGDDAEEELDVIPSAGSGVVLSRATIDQCMNPHYVVAALKCEEGFERQPDHVRQAHVAAWLEDHVDPLLARLDELALSFLGGDFGRSGDLTVLMPGQVPRNSTKLLVPFTVELRNTPFREQEQILKHVGDRLPNFMAGAVDARGLGASIAERAAQHFGFDRVALVMATVEWYRGIMPKLVARFEDRTIELPRDDDIRQDLRSLKKDKGVIRVPETKRTKSTRGGQRHGDAAIAAAMLEHATHMEVAPIEFASTGDRRVALDSYAERPGAAEIDHGIGFGIVRGGVDTTGF